MEIRKYQILNLKETKSINKILSEVKKIPGIFNVSIDKQTRIMIVEISDPEEENREKYFKGLFDNILKAVKKGDKSAKITRIDESELFRKVLYLNGLDCAYCAQRIENIAKKELNHERIVVDYPTYRFIIETRDKHLIDNIEKKVTEVAHKVDERIIVQPAEKGKPQSIEVASRYKISTIVAIIIGLLLIVLGTSLIYYKYVNLYGIKALFDETLRFALTPVYVTGVILNVIGYLLVGHKILVRFIKNLFKGRVLDENFLMSIASIGALATQHWTEAGAIMALYQLGEILQNVAVNKSRKSIVELLQYDAQTVKLKVGNGVSEVGVEGILKDDVIIVSKGEMIPVDGVVCKGKTVLDTKNITGESNLREVSIGSDIISGSINVRNVIEVRVKNTYNNSMMTRILDLVENATINKSKTENFVAKFCKIYTPIVVSIAFIILLYGLFISIFLKNLYWYNVVYAAMNFLVIACPCALVISVPLSYFCSIGVASKRGILIRGSNYIEAMANVENIVFDKTGTLTKGKFSIVDCVPKDKYKAEDVLRLFIYTEYFSEHPIGQSIVDSYGRNDILTEIITEFQDLPGGATALINGSRVLVANNRLAKREKLSFEEINTPNLVLYIFKDKKYIGYVVIGDMVRDEAKEAIRNIKDYGASRSYMLTGDSHLIADNIANALDIDEVFSELLPDQKVDYIDDIKKRSNRKGGTTVYVGDGINDAPVIAASDVGIAIGDTASDATISIADIVIMSNDLNKITELAKLSRKTKTIIIFNICFILTVKIVVMALAVFFMGNTTSLPLILSIFADVGVCLIAILNSLTLLKVFGKQSKIDLGSYNE